jgi:methylthioribose-1-phosphate isomerase
VEIPELQTLCASPARDRVEIVDQTRLPHARVTVSLASGGDAAHAIRAMQVRGAPLIGATAAYGLALVLRADPSDAGLAAGYALLVATRPTAVNLRWALDRVRARAAPLAPAARAAAAWAEADAIAAEDVATNRALGEHGVRIRYSPIATPARWRRWVGERRRPRSISLTPPESRCTYGLARLGRGCRAPD